MRHTQCEERHTNSTDLYTNDKTKGTRRTEHRIACPVVRIHLWPRAVVLPADEVSVLSLLDFRICLGFRTWDFGLPAWLKLQTALIFICGSPLIDCGLRNAPELIDFHCDTKVAKEDRF